MSLSRSANNDESSEASSFIQVQMERLNRFEQDNDRINVATNQITKYVQALSIYKDCFNKPDIRLDEYIAYLNKERESGYYKNIQQAIAAGRKVCAAEYYYFALVTDNLQAVDVETLEDAESCFSCDNCRQNLDIIKAALHFQRAQTPDDKKFWNQKLSDAIRYPYRDDIRTLFLNAAGIDISGADLQHVEPRKGGQSRPHLNLADLRGAKLDGCNLFSFHFFYSDLTGASLKNVKGLRDDERRGPSFMACTARNACLDGIDAAHSTYQLSTFTGASFKGAHFFQSIFIDTIFDNANFEFADIELCNRPLGTGFKDAIFVGASMRRMNFADSNDCDYDAVRFLDLTKIHNLADLKSQLDALSIAKGTNAKDLHAFQNLLANDVLRCADECFDKPEMQCDVIDLAIRHRLFHQQESAVERLAENAKSIYNASLPTMFQMCGRLRSANPVVNYLQEKRDAIDSVNYPEWSP